LHVYLGDLDHRIKMPEVIGHEGSGTILKTGAGVKGFSGGDRVVVMPILSCGACPACVAGNYHVCHKLRVIGIEAPGAMQARWTVPASLLFRIPDALSLEHAALIEPTAVACHDIRVAQLVKDEYAVVLGGGPIGALIALVAKHKGARVVVSEINSFRIKMLRDLGLDVLNPRETNLPEYVLNATGGAGADCVFEVTGVAPGAEMMTEVAKCRGRLIVVGVFAKPAPVNLYRIFQRELQVAGARVYQREDFDEALAILADGGIPAAKLITDVLPLERLQYGLEQMASGGQVMKILMTCSA
jgi:2-desacetyl-2-hydroxyethyl bacteriochlorophyllide A dehydrogenase